MSPRSHASSNALIARLPVVRDVLQLRGKLLLTSLVLVLLIINGGAG